MGWACTERAARGIRPLQHMITAGSGESARAAHCAPVPWLLRWMRLMQRPFGDKIQRHRAAGA